MARQHRFRLLSATASALALPALLFLHATLPATAQEAAPPPTPAEEELEHDTAPPPRFFGKKGHSRGHGKERERLPMPPPPVPPDLDKLSPEERERFERNRKRWEALSPEERDALRKHHEERRERLMREVNKAIDAAGLTLTDEQRREFAMQFVRERRSIEREIRREMSRKRREAVDALIQRMTGEYKAKAEAGANPTAEPSGKPVE